MPLHPAWVKNISRRVLWAALEKDITKADRLEMHAFFGGNCCYCDTPLSARWHADHLVSFDAGGYNHISNRVPACPRCNEVEKQEVDWQEFLKIKADGNDEVFLERYQRIESWVTRRKYYVPPVTDEQRKAWETEVKILADAIDGAWDRLKAKGLADIESIEPQN